MQLIMVCIKYAMIKGGVDSSVHAAIISNSMHNGDKLHASMPEKCLDYCACVNHAVGGKIKEVVCTIKSLASKCIVRCLSAALLWK